MSNDTVAVPRHAFSCRIYTKPPVPHGTLLRGEKMKIDERMVEAAARAIREHTDPNRVSNTATLLIANVALEAALECAVRERIGWFAPFESSFEIRDDMWGTLIDHDIMHPDTGMSGIKAHEIMAEVYGGLRDASLEEQAEEQED